MANGDLRRRRVSARAKADAEAELHADFDPLRATTTLVPVRCPRKRADQA